MNLLKTLLERFFFFFFLLLLLLFYCSPLSKNHYHWIAEKKGEQRRPDEKWRGCFKVGISKRTICSGQRASKCTASHLKYSPFAFSRKELITAYYMYIFSLDCRYSGQGCHAEPIACKLEAKDQLSSGPRPLGYEMPFTYVCQRD